MSWLLTLLPLEKIDAISQTFSYILSWVKSFVFWFEFDWSLVKWSDGQYGIIGLGNGLALDRRKAITWNNADTRVGVNSIFFNSIPIPLFSIPIPIPLLAKSFNSNSNSRDFNSNSNSRDFNSNSNSNSGDFKSRQFNSGTDLWCLLWNWL